MSVSKIAAAEPLAQAQAALAASEARYRALVQAFSEAVWSYGAVSGFEPGVKWWCELTGQSPDEAANEGWFHAIHPDDRARALEVWHRSLTTGELFSIEYRVRTADGNYRHLLVRGVPVGDPADHGWVGTFTDITDRKRAEEENRESGRRLLELQEQERRFLAAELHDSIGQCLAGLNYQLDLAARDGAAAEPLAKARALVAEITNQVRELSHRLRPAALDHLGLEAALRWLAEQLHQQTGVSVQLRANGLDQPLPPVVEAAAFRIIQESLTNVARHSGSNAAEVVVDREPAALEVRVRDRGRGFDPARIDPRASRGITGMRDRVHWLSGTLEIDSGAGRGTRVVARIPIEPVDDPAAEGESDDDSHRAR
jgi:two-component system sensor histidine kinase UhpB